MKIGEVSGITGLSERTIRYYEAERLIRPATHAMNQRSYREYSAADVDALNEVVVLRRSFFSVPDIRAMLEHPDRIPAILQELRDRTSEETAAKARVIAGLDRIDVPSIADIAALAAALRGDTVRNVLPMIDRMPHFGRFDGVTPDERAQAFRVYLARADRKAHRAGRRLATRVERTLARRVWLVTGLLVAALAATSVLYATATAKNAEYRRLQAEHAYMYWVDLDRIFEAVDAFDFDVESPNRPVLDRYVNAVVHAHLEAGLPDWVVIPSGGWHNDLLDEFDTLLQGLPAGPASDAVKRTGGILILKAMSADLHGLSQRVLPESSEGMARYLDEDGDAAKELQSQIADLNKKYAKILDAYWGRTRDATVTPPVT